MTDVTPDPIMQVATGFMAAKCLFVANEVGLFPALAEGPSTLEALAQQLSLARDTTRILVDAMVALRFVERHGDQYHNGPVAAAYLAGRTVPDLRPWLRFWDQLTYPDWLQFEGVVRGGQFVPPALTAEQQRIFSEGV